MGLANQSVLSDLYQKQGGNFLRQEILTPYPLNATLTDQDDHPEFEVPLVSNPDVEDRAIEEAVVDTSPSNQSSTGLVDGTYEVYMSAAIVEYIPIMCSFRFLYFLILTLHSLITST